MMGKTAIVTGYGGIAYEVVRGLAERGYSVVMAGRDPVKGAAAAQSIGFDGVRYEALDLADPESILSFSQRMCDSSDSLDVVVCAAGVMMPDTLELTGRGIERQFQVNYLGHFELVGRLLPLLRKSPDPRVVTMSSVANRPFRFDLSDAVAARGYSAGISYALSKLCCLMYAVELTLMDCDGVRAFCVHPGFARTKLFSRSRGFTMRLLRGIFFVLPIIRQSARMAAGPAIFAATSGKAAGGAYYGPMFVIMGPVRRALMPLRAGRDDLRKQLWEFSEKAAGFKY